MLLEQKSFRFHTEISRKEVGEERKDSNCLLAERKLLRLKSFRKICF